MITFENVSLQYDARHTALRDINIQIGKGEFVFVVLNQAVQGNLLLFELLLTNLFRNKVQCLLMD